MNKQNQINVTLTEKDKLVCGCGSQEFQQIFSIYKVTTPIIGQTAGIVPKPLSMVCRTCATVVDKNTKTLKELEALNLES